MEKIKEHIKRDKSIKPVVILFSVFFLSIVLSSSLWSEEDKNTPQKGLFLGFSLPVVFFTGDFNGELVLSNNRENFFIPELNRSSGYGFSFGIRREKGLWDFTYYKLIDKNDSGDNEKNSYLYLLNLDAKPYLFAQRVFQSYLILGICIPWIKVENGSKKRKIFHEATYYGAGINIGAGLNVYIFPKLFISGQFIYRFMGMFYVKGILRRRDVTDLYVGSVNGPKQDKFLSLRALSFGITIGFCF